MISITNTFGYICITEYLVMGVIVVVQEVGD